VRARLGPGDPPLVVVADGEVGAVPFAALWNQVRGRYLVEDHALRFALSVREPRRAPAYPGETGPALLVADPAFDRGAHPSLRPLAGAAAEAHDIARLYHGSRVLAGANANAPAVLAALPRAALMHYAGHAVFDDERPLRSMLVLAPASTDHAARGEWPAANDGALTAETIVSLDLRRVQLVVLSACETVGAAAGRAGGFAGLAGAFVAAGAGGVVGAQWRVEDGATSALMRAFHRAYARSGDAAAALRVAQLELLRSDDRVLRSPAAWAGFRYLGR
jgi:CHAT domain-containing protein